MAQEDMCSTLAFTKSPKTSKRTSFQDELEAVVSERAVRNRASYLNSLCDDDGVDDDDVLTELLKTRRRNRDMFKAPRPKSSINDFKLSDDEEEEEEEEENIKPKKVSFLKSHRNANSLRSETLGSNALKSDPIRSDNSVISPQSANGGRDRSLADSASSTSPTPWSSSQSESSAWRRSLSESPLPLYSENSQKESVFEATPPTPAPRHRAPHSAVGGRDETMSSRADSPPASNPFTFTSSQIAGNSGTRGRQDGVSVIVNTHSSPLEGVESSVAEHTDNKEHEEHQLSSEVAPGTYRATVSRPGSSRRSRSTPSFIAEPKYLGTLKVLELSLQETGPDSADTLRATVYQDWLKKKEEKLQETVRAKKQEKLEEEKKNEKEASKKAEAKALYEVWKEKKHDALKEKIREKQEAMRKLKEAMDDKEERKETAKQMFEKWKREHDEILREQQKERLQAEIRLQEKKEKEKEQRRRDSSSSFAQWSAKKKEVIGEKLKSERKQKEFKEIEEKYVKEEREKSALDMYEEWLKKKEFQQKQERKEKQKKADVFRQAPPPWSPANRTIPFGK